jgi:deoxyribonuclease-4
MSMAGGYYRAVEAAHKAGCDCVQLFTKNNNQWRAKGITERDVELFREALNRHDITNPISHASYLLNLASPNDGLWSKSIDGLVVEVERADALGIPYVVFHPGAYTDSTETRGIRRIIRALNTVIRRTHRLDSYCLLETTAGQGTNLGWRFEHLGAIIDGIKEPERVGVCLDTCHVFAAGYPLAATNDYRTTMRAFDENIGRDKLRAIHLNDSKIEFGSRVDRHQHIGEGHIGIDGFAHLMNDRHMAKIPMYLETPKGMRGRRDLDRINLAKLRGLVRR